MQARISLIMVPFSHCSGHILFLDRGSHDRFSFKNKVSACFLRPEGSLPAGGHACEGRLAVIETPARKLFCGLERFGEAAALRMMRLIQFGGLVSAVYIFVYLPPQMSNTQSTHFDDP